MRRRREWRSRIPQGECIRGWVFFALNILVFPVLMGWVQKLLISRWDLFLPVAEASLVYYLLVVTLVFLVFWNFLRDDFSYLLDFLPENLLAMLTGLAGATALTLLVRLVPLPVENPSLQDYPQQLALSPQATWLILVVLYPIVEETLFRGLLFGSVRLYSRTLAWVLSAAVFCLFKVWQFAILPGAVDLRYLLLAVQYLPMALGLTWCYDQGGSVWSPIVLHAVINGIYLRVLL